MVPGAGHPVLRVLGNWQDSATETPLAAAPGVRGIAGDTALFSSAEGSTITLDGANPSLAGLAFNSGDNGFTIAPGEPGGTLTLDNGTATASIAVAAGSQTISAPVALESNVVVVPAAGSQLTISGAISGAGSSLTLDGSGTLILGGANGCSGGTTVSAGTLVVTSASALAAGTSLTVGADAGLFFGSTLEATPLATTAPAAAASADAASTSVTVCGGTGATTGAAGPASQVAAGPLGPAATAAVFSASGLAAAHPSTGASVSAGEEAYPSFRGQEGCRRSVLAGADRKRLF